MSEGHETVGSVGDMESERLRREARDWHRRLTSGEVTGADLDALDRWRGESPAHRRAFAEANLLWDVLEPVARHAKAHGYAADAGGVEAVQPLRRRLILGGAMAAAVGGVAYVSFRSPLGLWPTLPELVADYRTATGERRQLPTTEGVSVEMNTRTSLAARNGPAASRELELLSGEVSVKMLGDASQPITIIAAGGQARAERAHFDVRKDASSVCVTCTEGTLRVNYQAAAITLQRGQQVSYGERGLGPVAAVDAAVVTSWQRGLLIFRDVPLAQVVDEVNRYRPGRIILMNTALAERKVVAGFRLDQIDDIVAYVCDAFDARARLLPGGIVLLT